MAALATSSDLLDGQPSNDFDADKTTIEEITKGHPERDRWMQKYYDYRLLYKGGDDFLRVCGQTAATRSAVGTSAAATNVLNTYGYSGQRARRFLWQLEAEPDAVYSQLWNRAFYTNYYSAISDYHRQWLFSEQPTIRPADGGDAPDWFAPFLDDASGSGKSLNDFVRDVFLDVLVCRRAGWLIGRNSAVGQREEDGTMVLTPYPAEQIYDWERDSAGELLWVIVGTHELKRQFPAPRVEQCTFTYLDRERWVTWMVDRGPTSIDPGKGDGFKVSADGFYSDDRLIVMDEASHTLGKVPFVMMEIPEGLWIGDKLAAPCVTLFNKQNRLENAQLLACIVQMYLKTNSPTKRSVTIGEGYLVMLQTADAVGGNDEDFGWKSPDVTPLEFIAKSIADLRDEVYRIVHQMSLAVDSKAVGAIARSGASKIEDRKASEIILAAYGGYVSEAMLRTLHILGEIYGDETEFSLDGYKNFDVSSLDEEIQIASLAQSMNFKSKTAKEELELKVIGRLLEFVDEKTMETITEETREGYAQAEEQAQAMASTVTAPVVDAAAVGQKLPTEQSAQQAPFGAVSQPKKLGESDKEAK